jgi:valyl-tRNA synthetase
MPFVSEEIYHQLQERNDDLCVKLFPTKNQPNQEILNKGTILKNVISGLRDVRNKQQIKPKETITLHIQTKESATFKSIESIIAKQVNTSSIHYTEAAIEQSLTVVMGKDTFYIITEKPIDTSNQKSELEKELIHLQGFLLSVEKKLSNEKFVQNAKPEVLALEQKKKSDAETKIKVIEDSLAKLNA